MSRRCFLGAAGAALAAPYLMASAAESGGVASDLTEYVDLASFRPKPEVRVMSAVVRLKPPYWLGWPGTSYDVEERRAAYCAAFDDSARRVGATLSQEAQPIEDEAAIAAFVAKIHAEKPGAVLLLLQHRNVWPWVDAISKAGVPTIVFSPIGTSFTQHVKDISRRQGIHVISTLDTEAVTQAMRMVRAKAQMEQTKLLVVAGEERKEEVVDTLGTTLKRVPRRALHELFEKMPECDETHEVAKQMRRGARKVVEPTDQDTLNAARSYMTAKRLMKDEGVNAITTDCLGMVTTKVVPTPPCMAATMFQDAGVTYGCEADINAALSLLLTSYLLDKPGFQNDPVPETHKNLLITAHCSSGTRLNGFDQGQEPYLLRSHSESGIGVSTQVLWKEGQKVTLVKVQNPKEIIVDTGTVVANIDTPPAGGCRTNFEIQMDRVEDARDVLGFHQVVSYGDHRHDVEAFCQMYGIRAIHSPEHAPEPVLS
ncbi:MAG: hypothetical protein HYZ00_09790 [Candidatus Hydrogenedentes bacterium]|nr:hypothetical protein [Candidatus Hydrogenedentota bacterium]